MSRYLLVLLSLLLSYQGFAQKKIKEYEVQEVKKSDLDAKAFKDYPGSQTRILFDLGGLTFVPEDGEYKIERSRHVRIKSLNDTLISAHNLGLTNFDYEDLESLLHYSEANIVGDERKADWEKVNKYLPLFSQLVNFKPGDILEFQFKETLSAPDQVPGWQFEYEIPVDWSELHGEVPELFKYRPIFKGYVELDLNESELLKDKNGSWVEIDGFFVHEYRFLCKKIPPFQSVEYSPSSKNFLTSVDFYLEEIKAHGKKKARKGKSWDSIAAELNNEKRLGQRVKDFSNPSLIQSLELDSNIEFSIIKCYNWVRENIRWNGEIGIYAEHNLSEVVEKKEGSIAEINLLLAALLKHVDTPSSPVVLRTVDQGELNMEFPGSNQFNYLIVWVDMYGSSLTLDASEACLEIGLIRPSSLNSKGLKVNSRFEEWVELDKRIISKNRVVCQSRIDDSSLLANVVINRTNYFAYRDCFNYEDPRELVRMSEKMKIYDEELTRRDSIIDGNKIFFKANADDYVTKSGNVWSMKPFWFDMVNTQPFTEKTRKFPIVYPYLFEYSWTFSLAYDENSTSVISGGEAEEIATPDNSHRFIYDVKQLDGIIQVTAQFSILKRFHQPTSYEWIVDFYKSVDKLVSEEFKIKLKNQ